MAYREVSRVEIAEVVRRWQSGISQRGISTHISHINPAGLAAISNSDTRCSRIAEHSGYHEC